MILKDTIIASDKNHVINKISYVRNDQKGLKDERVSKWILMKLIELYDNIGISYTYENFCSSLALAQY